MKAMYIVTNLASIIIPTFYQSTSFVYNIILLNFSLDVTQYTCDDHIYDE